jgi:PAS domain S-box-containing protein
MDSFKQSDFQQIFEWAPGLFLVLSPDLFILTASNEYLEATMTDRNAIAGKHLFDVFPDNPNDREATGVSNLHSSLKHVLRYRTSHTMAVQKYDVRKPNGIFEERYWSPVNKPVLNNEGEVKFIIHRVEDVTDYVRDTEDRIRQEKVTKELQQKVEEMEMEIYKRAAKIQAFNKDLEEQVRIKTQELQEVFSRVSDGFYALDRTGCFTYINERASELLRYHAPDLIGKNLWEEFPADAISPEFRLTYEAASKDQQPKFVELFSKAHQSWFETRFYPSTKGISVFFTDVTEKRKIANEIIESRNELRALAAHIESVREEERIKIAREIHDELGQQLTGLKMDISWLRKRLTNVEENILLKLVEILELLDISIKTVRKISSDLRPGVLDDLGIIAALEWQSSEFEKRYGIPVQFNHNIEELLLPGQMATGLFRIYQESLTNVARHAEAKEVQASLNREIGEMTLKIVDNGKGFNPETSGTKKTLGLLGMKERTLMMGGEYDIMSEPGKGTIVKIKVPFPTENKTVL